MDVTLDQLSVFGVLIASLALFLWNRLRYDVVAVLVLLGAAIVGLVPPERVFSGFGHPAVITVAGVLVISRALVNAGVVDSLARRLTRVGDRPAVQVGTLTGIVALTSGFMNNVGALALLMPVAIWMSRRSGRSPALLLMPLAFGSLLGGMLTLIGTPPNIIIAAYREHATGTAFGMFDFLPVGAAVTIAGVAFIALLGWRMTPRRADDAVGGDLFDIGGYMAEVLVPPQSAFVGLPLRHALAEVGGDAEVVIIGLVRRGEMQEMPSVFEILHGGDILVIEAGSEDLDTFVHRTGFEIEAGTAQDGSPDPERSLHLAEIIVTPSSSLVGRTAVRVDLRNRYGLNLVAVARQGHRLNERLGNVRFVAGDILLVQGEESTLKSRLAELGCLPLASRGLRIGKPRNVILSGAIFGAVLAAVSLDLVPPATAMIAGAVAMVLVGLIGKDESYRSIDMPVIVLLAAMLPIGEALETTGGSRLMADALLAGAASLPPAMMLAILMTAIMLLSNVINNAAAAVLSAPIAIDLAHGLGASVDPFLMAVAIASSSAFLTPIGHQSNALVMAPGGYRFGDYWRMGLPLSILIVAIADPVILWVWPL
jgi:di/tricarboxylate transporter